MFPAARVTDQIVSTATVFIGGMPAARITDATAGGGVVIPPGAPTVLIGG